jgi:hypothetical protein
MRRMEGTLSTPTSAALSSRAPPVPFPPTQSFISPAATAWYHWWRAWGARRATSTAIPKISRPRMAWWVIARFFDFSYFFVCHNCMATARRQRKHVALIVSLFPLFFIITRVYLQCLYTLKIPSLHSNSPLPHVSTTSHRRSSMLQFCAKSWRRGISNHRNPSRAGSCLPPFSHRPRTRTKTQSRISICKPRLTLTTLASAIIDLIIVTVHHILFFSSTTGVSLDHDDDYDDDG